MEKVKRFKKGLLVYSWHWLCFSDALDTPSGSRIPRTWQQAHLCVFLRMETLSGEQQAIWNMELQNTAECFLSWTAISRENIPVSRRLPMKKRGRDIFWSISLSYLCEPEPVQSVCGSEQSVVVVFFFFVLPFVVPIIPWLCGQWHQFAAR